MCGIVGIASKSPVTTDRGWLNLARDSMVHRGPDDAGEWWSGDNKVGIAQRRLAIIDLSAAGHQPMHAKHAALSIVYNGEIYNFTELRGELADLGWNFVSHSDTEVLLAAYDTWGTDCLSRLNGMFAFALYDARAQRLFLARDRAGEKPLFYHMAGGTLYFASELKALLANPNLPRSINPESLNLYLTMGYVPGDRCILQGYSKLPPAHAMCFDLHSGTSKIWRYWQAPDYLEPPSNGAVDEKGLLDELERLLENAVRRQLVADVPVGVLLSGGVDSSLITAMAVRASDKVRTFTIGFSGHGSLDETEHARLIARAFGTDHTELNAEPDAANLLSQLARQFDEPIVDSSMIPTFLVSQLVRQHCTVALGGDGGDELFGGYGHYSRLVWMQEHLGRIPRPMRQATSFGAEHALPVGMKGRNWLQGLGVDLQNELPLIANYFDKSTRGKLLPGYFSNGISQSAAAQTGAAAGQNILQRATRMDFHNYLAEDILVKVDRASMLNSLEVRAPMLDRELIEFAYGRVPSYLKANTRDKKILLKRLAQRVLPPAFDQDRKQGFSIPMAEWLKAGPLKDLFHSVLLDKECIFDRKTVTGLLEGQQKGRSNGERLFALVLFELWRREYAITL